MMNDHEPPTRESPVNPGDDVSRTAHSQQGADGLRVCPVCRGSTLIEIRGKLQCARCHTICETCCEGGRG